MNPIIIAFLLGLSPSDKFEEQIWAQWHTLSSKGKATLIIQFETEYNVKLEDLTDQDLKQIKRETQLRAYDMME